MTAGFPAGPDIATIVGNAVDINPCEGADMSGIKRYTELPYLLHMLRQRKITLLNPKAWADRNDSYFLERYIERRGLQSVLVMCLSTAAATYHHWHVFAPGASGIRIEFDKDLFKAWAKGIPNARLKRVAYLRIDTGELAQLGVDRLPFAKRHAFRDEGEVRLIVECAEEKLAFLDIPFDYDMIKEVQLSPWLAPAAVKSVKEAIRAAAPASQFKITRTSMLENKTFMAAADGNELQA